MAVFAAALALRLAYVLAFPLPAPTGDQLEYDRIAIHLARGEGFASAPGVPTPARAPGYPAFLAGVYWAAGQHPAPVRLLQALLGAWTCLLAFQIARESFGDRTALWAGGMLAAYPVLIVYTDKLLSETLFTFLLAASMLWIQRFFRGWSVPDAARGGLLLGLATLVRPVTTAFSLVLLAAAGLKRPRSLPRAALLPVLVLGLAVPWCLRNDRLFGEKALAARGPGFGLFVTGLMTRGWRYEEGHLEYARIAAEPPYREPAAFTPGSHPLIELEERLRREGLEAIRSRPGAYLLIVLRRLPRFWATSHSSVFGVDRPLTEYLREGRWGPVAVRLGLLGFHVALCAAAAWGLALSAGRWREILPLALVPAYFTLHIAFDLIPRYHLPALPYVFILAAAALAGQSPRLRTRMAASSRKPTRNTRRAA